MEYPYCHIASMAARPSHGLSTPDFSLIRPRLEGMDIAHGIDQACHRIRAACEIAGRSDSVALQLAVKTRTSTECAQAARILADRDLPILLGHNRVQEAAATAEAIHAIPGARLHLIGPLQSNKVNHALRWVDGIDTIDRVDLIHRLNRRLTILQTENPLPVLVQVNVSGEEAKSGCHEKDCPALVEAIIESTHLDFRGFMTVGLNSPEEGPVRRAYERLRTIRNATAAHLGQPEESLELSMGMSRDLEWAIAEGATIIRIGTAVFGARSAI